MIICVCKAVGERTLRLAIQAGARSVDDLARETGACTDCGTCAEHLEELLAEELSPAKPASVHQRPGTTSPEEAA